MFELCAEGRLSDEAIVEKINAMGYRTPTYKKKDRQKRIVGSGGGKLLTVKHMRNLIRNLTYVGVIKEKWTHFIPVRAQWDGLVSLQTFNRANRGKVFVSIFKDKSGKEFVDVEYNRDMTIKRRSKKNPNFPFRRIVLCPFCGKPFAGSFAKSKSKRRFPYYHCAKGHKYYGVSKQRLENDVLEFVKNIKFTPETRERISLILRQEWDALIKTKQSDNLSTVGNVDELKSQQEDAVSAMIASTSPIARKHLESRIEELENQIENAKIQIKKDAPKDEDFKAFMRYCNFLMEHPEKLLLDKSNMHNQEFLFGLLFEDFPTYLEIINRTPKLRLPFAIKEELENKKYSLAG